MWVRNHAELYRKRCAEAGPSLRATPSISRRTRKNKFPSPPTYFALWCWRRTRASQTDTLIKDVCLAHGRVVPEPVVSFYSTSATRVSTPERSAERTETQKTLFLRIGRTSRHATTNNRAETESSHPLLAKHDRQAVGVTAAAASPGAAGALGRVPAPRPETILLPHAHRPLPACGRGSSSTRG